MSAAGRSPGEGEGRGGANSPLARLLAELAHVEEGEPGVMARHAPVGRSAADRRSPTRPARRLARPAKHSLTIAGHRTSVSLEEAFWMVLRAMAEVEGISLNALAGRIDAERLVTSGRTPPAGGGPGGAAGLSGALRVAALIWLVDRLGAGAGAQVGGPQGRR